MTEANDSPDTARTQREVSHSPGTALDGWDAIREVTGGLEPGSVTLVLAERLELARALVLNLLAQEAHLRHRPGILIDSSKLAPCATDALFACAYCYPAENVWGHLEDPVLDMIRENCWDNLEASQWAVVRDPAGWLSRLESIGLCRKLGADVRYVFIDSLEDLHIHGVRANDIRSRDTHPIGLIVQALKAVSQVQRVAVVAAASTACEDSNDPFSKRRVRVSERGHLDAADRVLVVNEPLAPDESNAGLPEGAQIVQVRVTRPDGGRQQLVDIMYQPRFLRFSVLPARTPSQGADV